jgi:hypothetical protein
LDTEEKFTSESKAEEEEEAQERKQSKAKQSKAKKKTETKEFTKMSHKMHKLQDDKTTVPLYFNSKIPFFFFFFCLLQNGSGSKQNGTLRFRFF